MTGQGLLRVIDMLGNTIAELEAQAQKRAELEAQLQMRDAEIERLKGVIESMGFKEPNEHGD